MMGVLCSVTLLKVIVSEDYSASTWKSNVNQNHLYRYSCKAKVINQLAD